MYNTKDMFGQEIKPGDVIIYNVKNSSSIATRLAVVDKVIDNGASTYERHRYQLKVRTYTTDWRWDSKLQKSNREPRIYKATLDNNSNIIKLNSFKLPEDFITLLRAAIV